MICDDSKVSSSTISSPHNTDNLASVANVVEDLAKRELTLFEWQRLDELLETGTPDQEAVRQMLEICQQRNDEDDVQNDVCLGDIPEDGEMLGEILGCHEEELDLQGEALIVGNADLDWHQLETDLMVIGVNTHHLGNVENLMAPIPELTGLAKPMDYIFVHEHSCEGQGDRFCQALMSLGRDGACSVFLIDEGLGLIEDWDDWPLAGFLTRPFGPRELRAVLKGA